MSPSASLARLSSSSVSARVASAGDERYQASLSTYYAQQQATLKPLAIVMPESTQDVSDIIKILSETGGAFSIRAGGHGQFPGASNSEGGITIDLGKLNAVSIAQDRKSVTIGGGARWGDAYSLLDEEGLAVAGGRQLDTGVGGLTLGGGISFHSPQAGFVCDSVLDFEVVLAGGEVVHASKDCRADLWRALKGGSNNFGVVTKFTFRAFECGPVWGGTKMYALESAPQHLDALHDFAANVHDDVHATVIQAFCYFNGPTGAFEGLQYTAPVEDPPVFKKFFDIQPTFKSTTGMTTIHKLAQEQSAFNSLGHSQALVSTSFLNDRRALGAAFDAWHESIDRIQAVEGAIWCISLHAVTKPMMKSSADAGGNVMGLQDSPPLIVANISATWDDRSKDSSVVQEAQGVMNKIDVATKAVGAFHPYRYLNYSWAGVDVVSSYGVQNKTFMQDVSKRYDPKGIFQEQCTGGFKLFK